MTWTASDIPDQINKRFIITGANAGIGLATARALSSKGGEIIMAVRNVEKGEQAAADIRAEQPHANLHVMPLDLSKLDSVRSFTTSFLESFDSVDVLINNAGVYESGSKTTAEGYALMMGVNHLGHFALTGLLVERLLETPQSRIVTLSSGAYSSAELDLETFHTIEAAAKGAYGKSKLANMLFVLELQRRLSQIDTQTISVSVGPGPTKSGAVTSGIQSISNRLLRGAAHAVTNILMSPPESGSLPIVRAATDADAKGGDYFVPGGFRNLYGSPVASKPKLSALQERMALGLWERSVELTGVKYDQL